MQPKGSLPNSQAPATCPYPEPDKYSPWPPSHFCKIHVNIILPSKPRSSNWFSSLGSPQQNTLILSPHTCHRHRPSHSSFDHQYICRWAVQIIKFLVKRSSPIHRHLVPLRPAPYSRTASTYVPPSMWVAKTHTHTKQHAKLQFPISWSLSLHPLRTSCNKRAPAIFCLDYTHCGCVGEVVVLEGK